ncbi:MAG TPA: protein phosphatase 2C domain-containing protein [Polyangiaceae bacterium LLY-WYZ-15_(1-7)]|nr:protein phosphatase 2C domain-containing protein [Polyangiaceae bacterium LLY-WYZ-15_(1-7)]
MSEGDARGAHRWIEASMDAPWTGAGAAGAQAAVFARPAEEGRRNEDAALVAFVGEVTVLAVADGAGGLPEGAHASRTAIGRLEEALGEEGPLRERILRGFERANEVIREVGVGATTLVVVEAAPGWVRTYCCGDSQALLVGGRGKLKLVTLPHSPVGYAVEAGFLEEAEARVHEERHLVSNLLGDDALRVTMHGPVERAAQDTVVVASDGLFDNLDPEAVAELACARPLEEAARALAERAWERMASGEAGTKVDDLALVLHRVG